MGRFPPTLNAGWNWVMEDVGVGDGVGVGVGVGVIS